MVTAPGAYSDADVAAMRLALAQAGMAYEQFEVPVGAVIVDDRGHVLATGFNRTIIDHDPTAHAEIVALREAARSMRNYRLPGVSLFVTLEPCAMCIGAMFHARVARVVYAAADPKTGACGSVLSVHSAIQINHQTEVMGGLLAQESQALLLKFFRERRTRAKGTGNGVNSV
jgi:tRNA(adenine34) deaminase